MKKIAFLVHPRDNTDFLRRFPYLRFLPKAALAFLTKHMPPVIVSEITGLTSKEGHPIHGNIIAITMTAKQMMEDRPAALKKIIQASKFAERRGVGIIGFGALTASLSKGGLDVAPEVKTMGITTGRAYTTKTVTDYVKACVDQFGFDKNKVKVAIVGAGGSIGSSCAKILAAWGVQHFLFVDVEKRAEHLKKQVEHMSSVHFGADIQISHAIKDIKGWDIVITATNAPEALVSSDDLLPGTIIVNDAQPSDVPPHVIKERNDILVIEGGVIHTPGIKCNFNLGLAGREDTFCCLGEVLVLAREGHFDNYAMGELDTDLVAHIEDMAKDLNFSISRFQNSVQKYIPEVQIEKVKGIIKERLSSAA
jgi:fatty aldehyde-generating acyl-ACP reductase